MSYGQSPWTPGPGARTLWGVTGNFAARGLTPAQAAARLQQAGYANEGLALAVAYKLPERLIISLAQATGASAEKDVWTSPVSGGFKLPDFPGLQWPAWTTWIPWVVGGVGALWIASWFVGRRT